MTAITRINTNAENLRGQVAPLYEQYQGQTSPQPAFIELDCESRSAEAKWTGVIGSAVPAYVWHRRALRFSIPSEVRGDAIADFLESETFQTLASRICDGYTQTWNGNNHVGRYSDDATAAREDLTQLIDDSLCDDMGCTQIISPEQYWVDDFSYSEDENAVIFTLHDGVIRITSETTDKELSELSIKLEELTDDSVGYTSGVHSWLHGLRDNLFEVSDDDKE